MNVGGAFLARRSKAKKAVPRPLLSYKQALAWLYGLQRFGIKLGLENIRRLIAELSRSGGFQAADLKRAVWRPPFLDYFCFAAGELSGLRAVALAELGGCTVAKTYG